MTTEARSVRRRALTHADGRTEVAHAVVCRESGGSSPLAECASCARCVALPIQPDAADAEVVCRVEPAPATDARRLPIDLVELALRTPIVSVAPRDVLAVEADVPIDVARRLLAEHAAAALVVVDADAQPVGVVTPRALLATSSSLVGDVARPVEMTVRDDTALVHALPGLVDTPAGSCLPVVNASGELVSLLSSVDVVRWLASRAGYDV